MSTTQRPAAIVTGAASGIARATALRLLEDGFDVLAVDRDSEGLDALLDLASVHRFTADLAEPDSARAVLEANDTAWGRLDAPLRAWHGCS